MAGIVLDKVSRVFAGGVVAVDRVDLVVDDKEFLVLVGPSGCGKSTTLRMIAGLEDVSSGDVRIGGRRVNDVPPKDRNIAMVFQNYALYPHMTVYKNMGFGLELRQGTGWLRRALWRVISPRRAAELTARRRQISEEVGRAAHILGIEHLLDRMPRQLSGGERQRVALGRAIVRQPAAFLFDEPLSNLDAQLRVEMRREIKELHRRLAATMVYVTHDQVEALTLGQRIVVMDRGVVQQVGAPMEVYDQPKNRFVAGFIGTPPMNFIAGTFLPAQGNLVVRRGGGVVGLGSKLAARLQRIGMSGCVLGVRPEDLRLTRVASASGTAEGGAAESAAMPGVVDMIEPLGDATLVTVRCSPAGLAAGAGADGTSHINEGLSVVIKSESRVDWRAGETVQVVFAAHRAHVFDSETGENRSPATHEA